MADIDGIIPNVKQVEPSQYEITEPDVIPSDMPQVSCVNRRYIEWFFPAWLKSFYGDPHG